MILCALLIATVGALLSVFPAEAQSPVSWTDARVVAETTTYWSRPTIAADPWGGVHVVWSDFWSEDATIEPSRFGNTLFHAFWDGVGWSEPIDIVLGTSVDDVLMYPDLAIGPDGDMYLVWADNDGLYISYASALDAHSAKSWQRPEPIVTGGGVDRSQILLGPGDRLDVVFAKLQGDLEHNTLHAWSDDQGHTWSLPQAISAVYQGEDKVSAEPQIVRDDRGWIHSVWTERWSPDWIGRRVLYARSQDHGSTWTPPKVLGTVVNDEIWAEAPRLATTPDGMLHMVWVCGVYAHRCYRASHDGGETWTESQRIFGDMLSLAGYDALVPDSEGTLHLMAQLRYPEGIYYAYKPIGGKWSELYQVVARPAFDRGHYFASTISQGNQLHSVWQRGAQTGDVVHLMVTTGSDAQDPALLPVLPLTTPTSVPETLSEIGGNSSSDVYPDPITTPAEAGDVVGVAGAPVRAVLWGVLSAAAVVLALAVLRIRR